MMTIAYVSTHAFGCDVNHTHTHTHTLVTCHMRRVAQTNSGDGDSAKKHKFVLPRVSHEACKSELEGGDHDVLDVNTKIVTLRGIEHWQTSKQNNPGAFMAGGVLPVATGKAGTKTTSGVSLSLLVFWHRVQFLSCHEPLRVRSCMCFKQTIPTCFDMSFVVCQQKTCKTHCW